MIFSFWKIILSDSKYFWAERKGQREEEEKVKDQRAAETVEWGMPYIFIIALLLFLSLCHHQPLLSLLSLFVFFSDVVLSKGRESDYTASLSVQFVTSAAVLSLTQSRCSTLRTAQLNL